MSEFFYLLPLLIVLGGGIVIMLLGALEKLSVKSCSIFAILCLVVAELFQIASIGKLYSVEIYPQIFNGMLIADSFSGYFSFLLIMGAILTILIGQHYFFMRGHFKGEFFALMLFSVFGMMVLVQATELITAFIALEISSIGVYAMIGYQKSYKERVEAAYKYLVLGSLAGIFFLLGAALIYAGAGTTHLEQLYQHVLSHLWSELGLVALGGTMILVTFLFKIAAFPFQSWAIDVYDGSPLPVTGFMATTFKIAIFGFMLRVMLVDFDAIKSVWNTLLIGVIIFTLVYGTLMALTQSAIKRMLAASSIVHTGYLLIAFLSSDVIGSNAASSIIFYQIAYFLSAAGAFGLLSYIITDDKLRLTYNDFKGFAIYHPYMAASMSIFMLSLAGIPSTIGFIGKFYIFSGAIQAGYTILAVLGIVATFISVYYYFKLIAMMYFYPSPTITSVPVYRGITPKVIAGLALAIIWGGIGDVDFIIDLANIAYNSLFIP
jgi:NADH-quinone oxidoreductase subunit N